MAPAIMVVALMLIIVGTCTAFLMPPRVRVVGDTLSNPRCHYRIHRISSGHYRRLPWPLFSDGGSSSLYDGQRRRLRLQEEAIRRREREEREEEGEEGECLLVPESNPNSDPNASSLVDGVPYASVIAGIDALYPPAELSSRNARSRTDGYWKYVAKGDEPPLEYTYGEFDVEFFGSLLDRAWEHYSSSRGSDDDGYENATTVTTDNDAAESTTEGEERIESSLSSSASPWRGKTFCDIGSGAGRLVLAAAALHPHWRMCRGIEILPNLHDMAVSIAEERCRVADENDKARRRGLKPKVSLEEDDDDGGGGGDRPTHILRIPRNNETCDATSSTATTTTTTMNDRTNDNLPMAPVDFACGSFADPYEYLGDVDCAFVFSSCMNPNLLRTLSEAIGRQCRPGTIVVTTEFPLFLSGTIEGGDDDTTSTTAAAAAAGGGGGEEDESSLSMLTPLPSGPYELDLLEKIDGWCWLTGGESTAYVHRVRTSLWEEYGAGRPRERQRPTLEEEALGIVRLMERGELTDADDFLRRVRNDMIFHGVPPEFLPRIDDEEEEDA